MSIFQNITEHATTMISSPSFPLLLQVVVMLTAQTVIVAAENMPIPFGMKLFPSVVWDLEQNATGPTEPHCVLANNRSLCTTIDSCTKDAWDVYPSQNGWDFTPPQCPCTATLGDEECYCAPSTMIRPYLVTAEVKCPSGLQLDPGGFHSCTNPGASMCERGYLHMDVGMAPFAVFLDFLWTCKEGSASYAECQCSARYNYRECSMCEPCGKDQPADFALQCNSFSVDCDGNYHVEAYDESSASARTDVSWQLLAFVLAPVSSFFIM